MSAQRRCSSNVFTTPLKVMFCLLVLQFCFGTSAIAADTDFASERWEQIRLQLFGEKPIEEESGIISLDAPGRAFDGARVPITVMATPTPDRKDHIAKLYVIVDNNPMPLAGTFEFHTQQTWDTIDTELRVNEYSHLRAVAELQNGDLHMVSSYVKAVGGCSAPPSSYDRSDATLLGNFSGGIEQLLNPKVPAVARIRIVHPNASGMQFDQFTRTYIPAHYIHTMTAEFNETPLFILKTNFSLSQDPVLGFNFQPEKSGTLKMTAIDSKNKRFEQSWQVMGL